jgi:hypothetical protein
VSGVVAALRQAEALGTGPGSLLEVSRWWLEPVEADSSLKDLCCGSVAAKEFEAGLIKASHAYRRSRFCLANLA